MNFIKLFSLFVLISAASATSLYAVPNHFTLKLDKQLIAKNEGVSAWVTVQNPRLNTHMFNLSAKEPEKLIPLGNRYDMSITLKYEKKEGEKVTVDHKTCSASFQGLKDGFEYQLAADIKSNGACKVDLREMP